MKKQIQTYSLQHNDYVDGIGIGSPCILILGGEKTNSKSVASKYCDGVASVLQSAGIFINIYSIKYQVENYDMGLDRIAAFYMANPHNKRLIKEFADSITDLQQYTIPGYIHDIFDVAFRPRILDKKGRALPEDKIISNLRNMVIFAHCHGSTVVKWLEKLLIDELTDKSAEMGPNTIRKIVKNTIVINHAPFAPLRYPKFTSVSFVSTHDNEVKYYNELSEKIAKIRKGTRKIARNAFPVITKTANLMLSDQVTQSGTSGDEHNARYIDASKSKEKLTPHGEILFTTERNALITAAKAMQKKTKNPPHAQDMLQSDYLSYREAKKRGNSL